MFMMASPISTSTARDMVRGILEDVTEPPTMEAARQISDEYMLRGVYIKPEWLLDVWRENKEYPDWGLRQLLA